MKPCNWVVFLDQTDRGHLQRKTNYSRGFERTRRCGVCLFILNSFFYFFCRRFSGSFVWFKLPYVLFRNLIDEDRIRWSKASYLLCRDDFSYVMLGKCKNLKLRPAGFASQTFQNAAIGWILTNLVYHDSVGTFYNLALFY